eukprot:TRINITY_DN14086_c0_g2_i2.p1 TRINITY_DN14086_c0_g2~~TRINITY_DN14086_c0_g2_i2.p1  ORF type:complete len:364 (+),score=42.01 TRINITY_DN14086_c0_g2_i2:74-1165(+)
MRHRVWTASTRALTARSQLFASRVGRSGERSLAGRRSFTDIADCAGADLLSVDGYPSCGSAANSPRLAFATACLPHPEKAKTGGEDSYFACSRSRSFAVADGVGGWSEAGVDPGLFSRGLLRYSYASIQKSAAGEQLDLQEALWSASRKLAEKKIQGGSTALLGQLHGGKVSILNLGDSGAIILRPALRSPPGSDRPLLFPRVVFRSSDQTHYFNCPYQLGSAGPPTELPDLVSVRVRNGDVVIAATDGVFDNIFDHQVQALVAQHLGGAWLNKESVEPHLQGLATSIAQRAQSIGKQEDDRDVITPFALSAHSEGLTFRGGKLDDTTVVVALVCSDNVNEANESDDSSADGMPDFHNFDIEI